MGGATITAACLDAGLLDELRLIVYPIVVGKGMTLFEDVTRRDVELSATRGLSDGRVGLTYTIT